LTHLTFGYKFDQELNHLPASLTHLTFGENFDQEVNNLPDGLTHLTFGHRFNQPLKNFVGALPSTLEKLILPQRYKKYKSLNKLGADIIYISA